MKNNAEKPWYMPSIITIVLFWLVMIMFFCFDCFDTTRLGGIWREWASVFCQVFIATTGIVFGIATVRQNKKK